MKRLRWVESVDGRYSLQVRCSDRDTVARSPDGHRGFEYELTFESDGPDGLTFTTPPSSSAPVHASHGTASSDYIVVTPPESGLSRVTLANDDIHHTLYLPGPEFIARCEAAVEGDTDAAETLRDEVGSPVELVMVCGSFLSLDDVGPFVETLARSSQYVESTLFASRYDVVRGALASPVGLSVGSKHEAERLVSTLDGRDGIGSVDLVEALAETMYRLHDTPAETRSWLDGLGFDLATLERRSDDLFFACFLAHLVLTKGVRAAEGHVMNRRWNLDGDYERRVTRAKQTEYGSRGRAWRELVCTAARQSLDDFAFVLANALYWTGEEARTYSRMDEFLCEAAAAVAAEIDLSEVEGRARYERALSRGHRLRSQSRHGGAIAAFERAVDVAREHESPPRWKPVYNGGIVRSTAFVSSGDHESAIDALEETLDRVFQYDIHEAKLNEIVHHLEGKKLESTATLEKRRENHSRAVELLEEAGVHYDAIGFDRSCDRTRRKRRNLDQQMSSRSDAEVDSSPTPESTPDGAPESPESPSDPSDEEARMTTTDADGDATEPTAVADGATAPSRSDGEESETESERSIREETPDRREGRTADTDGEVETGRPVETGDPKPVGNDDPSPVDNDDPSPVDNDDPRSVVDDYLTPVDPEATGSRDLMTSPDDRLDEPYYPSEDGPERRESE